MSDTPITDLWLEQQIVCNYEHEMVSAGFARELERERNNLKREVERLKTMSVCELGAHNNSVRDYMEHWEGRALTAERERDEARAIAKYWQEQFGHSNTEHEWQSLPWEDGK